MADQEKIRGKIIDILIVISLLLAVIFTIWYMVGDSPTPEQFLIIIVLPLYLLIFRTREYLNNKINKSHRNLFKEIAGHHLNLSEKISQTRETFQKELGEIRQSLGRIEGKFNKE